MRLYHYLAERCLAGVQREGLTRGFLPVFRNGDWEVLPGFAWLTTSPNWRQPWDTKRLLTFDRTDYRLEVCIPKSHRCRLYTWPELKAAMCYPSYSAHHMESVGGSDDWRIFLGHVPPSWFRRVERNPKLCVLRQDYGTTGSASTSHLNKDIR